MKVYVLLEEVASCLGSVSFRWTSSPFRDARLLWNCGGAHGHG